MPKRIKPGAVAKELGISISTLRNFKAGEADMDPKMKENPAAGARKKMRSSRYPQVWAVRANQMSVQDTCATTRSSFTVFCTILGKPFCNQVYSYDTVFLVLCKSLSFYPIIRPSTCFRTDVPRAPEETWLHTVHKNSARVISTPTTKKQTLYSTVDQRNLLKLPLVTTSNSSYRTA